MDPVTTAVGGTITLVGVVLASWFTYRASMKKQRADISQQMIDQHQEDIANLRARVTSLERVTRIQGDYIGQLRLHIADGRPPPPPAWPTGLIT